MLYIISIVRSQCGRYVRICDMYSFSHKIFYNKKAHISNCLGAAKETGAWLYEQMS